MRRILTIFILSLAASSFAASYTNFVWSSLTTSNHVRTNILAASNSLAAANIATSNAIPVSASGSFAMGTGTVTQTKTLATFTNYSYAKVLGTVGTLTNSVFVVTNAGNYLINFGTWMAGSNTDPLSLRIITNGVVCDLVAVNYTAVTGALEDTGFKSIILTLPAMTYVGLSPTNASAANTMTLRNIVMTIHKID